MTLDPTLWPLAEHARHAAVLSDFDGTLSAIVDDPAAATALPEAHAALAALVDRMALVAVVSGRPVTVLAAALPIAGLQLVGQYGLERMHGGELVVDDRVEPYLPAVAAAADEAERQLPDLLVERKAGIAVTLHWRTAPQRGTDAAARAEELARRHGLVTYATRMAVELRPPVPVDKGTAVEPLLASGYAAACFAGDDRGDIPVFDALDRAEQEGRVTSAVRIAIGSPESPTELVERADLVVDDPPALAAQLSALADAAR